ncbi:unnamed protein product [Owenia fusiformis]|uniref:Carboxylic ester hydrolase n=1 Tax=Owenia fusiformis TaxID=6347 RepID=A0A8S4QB96_OWEFU|nr:unnamed protein product [Owenia fusiformis]
MALWTLLLVQFTFLYLGTQGQGGPIVEVGVGSTVRGVEEFMPNSNKPVYNFMGIPFAAPPINNLRFQPPQEIPLWTGELDGTDYGDICPNAFPWLPAISENCLFLNVWTPSTSQNSNMAVMVWMAGGGLQFGDGDIYEGTELAALEDVVVVTFNFRVGVLGFLTMGDSNAPGNVGILDQRMAFQWVQRHIQSFGGNPDAVTIFGESAGAMSVSYHLVSPMSRGLYLRAIGQSGVSTSCGTMCVVPTEVAVNRSFVIAQSVGCPQRDSAGVIACLRNLDWEDIEDHSFEYLPGPYMDGTFFTDFPLSTYSTGEFNRVDYLLGFNHDEGYMALGDLEPNRENIAALIRDNLAATYPENLDAIHQACMDVYVDYDSMVTDEDYERAYSYLLGDRGFAGPSHDVARKHSIHARTFLYLFNHRPQWLDLPAWVTAVHASDIPYVFGEPFTDSLLEFNEAGRALSRQMMTYWANFAKTGDPNGNGLPVWPQVNCSSSHHMELVENPRAGERFQTARMTLWMDTIPALDTSRIYRGMPWACPS